jgi:polynucleotide 5'-kinase involved in rRNA processing
MENERERGIKIAIVGGIEMGKTTASLLLAEQLAMKGIEVVNLSPDQAKELQKPIIITPSGLQASINPAILNAEPLLQGYFDGRSPRQKRREELKKAKKKKR